MIAGIEEEEARMNKPAFTTFDSWSTGNTYPSHEVWNLALKDDGIIRNYPAVSLSDRIRVNDQIADNNILLTAILSRLEVQFITNLEASISSKLHMFLCFHPFSFPALLQVHSAPYRSTSYALLLCLMLRRTLSFLIYLDFYPMLVRTCTFQANAITSLLNSCRENIYSAGYIEMLGARKPGNRGTITGSKDLLHP